MPDEPIERPLWTVVPEKTEEHWLEVRDPEGWWSASVKWDGCVHLNRYAPHPVDASRPGDEPDYLHICDLDEVIERLQAIKALALKHFKGNWPG